MKTVYIIRNEIGKNSSHGTCIVVDQNRKVLFSCYSLERGWQKNKKSISCIPEGKYPLRLEYSEKFERNLWEIYDVPNRSECKFHSANYWHELNGCIALGMGQYDLDKDGMLDVTSSRDALHHLHECLKGDKEARIVVIDDAA